MTQRILIPPLRTYPAVWAAVPALILVFVYAQSQTNLGSAVGYWTGVVGRSTAFVIFSCSVCAMLAAFDGARLKRAADRQIATVRPWWRVTWNLTWPTFALAVLLQAFGLYLNSSGTWGSPSRFPWEIIAAWLAMILLHVAFGLVLGFFLPLVISAPLALIGSYSWLGFLWALDYIPARYLSGLTMVNCCTPESRFPAEAAASAITFSLVAFLVILAIVRHKMQGSRIPVLASLGAMLTLGAGVTAALLMASSLGTMPNPPRDTAELHCEQGFRTVCAYPEQVWRAASDPLQDIDSALRKLSAAGIHGPDVVTTGRTDSPATITVTLARYFTTPMTVHSLAFSLANLRPDLVCDQHDPDIRYNSSAIAVGLAYAWMSDGQQDPSLSPEQAESVATLLSSPYAVAWFEATQLGLADCSSALPELP